MNTFFTKIKNIIKSFKHLFNTNPYKQWMMLLYIFFILVGFSLLVSFYLLYGIKNDKLFQVKVEQIQKKSLLKEDLLKKITGLYEEKLKRETEILSNPSVYKDPSL